MGSSYKTQVSRGGLDGSSGFLIRAAGMPHRTTMPSWEKETQFRIFPAPKEGGGWYPARLSAEDNDFSLAVWSEPVARRLGVYEQFTFITRIPGRQGESPTERFCNAMIQMIEEKPRDVPEDWIMWPKGGRGQPPKLAKVRNCVFFQGMTVMSQGKTLINAAGQPAPQFPSMLMGTISMQIFFEQLANKRIQGAQLPPDQLVEQAKTDETARKQLDQYWAAAFALGDWCSLEGGRVVRVYQAPPGDNFQRPHYEIQMAEAVPLLGIEAMVRSFYRPWEELLQFHTAEAQIELLSRAFPPEAVDFVFGHTEFEAALPTSVKGAWHNWKTNQGAWTPGMQPGVQTGVAATGAPAPNPPMVGPAAVQPTSTAVPPSPFPVPPSSAVLSPTPAAAASSAPAAVPPAPATVPSAPVAASAPADARQFDLSGGGQVPGEVADQPLMGSGAFAATPVEFQQPVGAGTPVAAQPTTAAPAGTPTPAAATGEVDAAKLNAALDDLQKGRDQAAEGNLGS